MGEKKHHARVVCMDEIHSPYRGIVLSYINGYAN